MHIGDPEQRKHVVRTKCNAGILLHISKSIRSFLGAVHILVVKMMHLREGACKSFIVGWIVTKFC